MVNLSHATAFFVLLFFCKASADDGTMDPEAGTPAPGTPAPGTPPVACTEQSSSLLSCSIALPDAGNSCLECWANSVPEGLENCSDRETKFCAAFASCDCGSCDSDAFAVTECLLNEKAGDAEVCQVDCEGDSSNPDTNDTGTGGGTSSDSPMPIASSLALIAGTILALTLF